MTHRLPFLLLLCLSASLRVNAQLLAPRQAEVVRLAVAADKVPFLIASRTGNGVVTNWYAMLYTTNIAKLRTVNLTNSPAAPQPSHIELSWAEPLTLRTSRDLLSWTNLSIIATRTVRLPMGDAGFFRVPLQPETVTLKWDASPSYQVCGYKIHYGRAVGAYDGLIDAGLTTEWRLAGLQPGSTYFFVVTAYDASSAESDASNLASFTPPVVDPVTTIRTAP